jgi:hypothetical protein
LKVVTDATTSVTTQTILVDTDYDICVYDDGTNLKVSVNDVEVLSIASPTITANAADLVFGTSLIGKVGRTTLSNGIARTTHDIDKYTVLALKFDSLPLTFTPPFTPPTTSYSNLGGATDRRTIIGIDNTLTVGAGSVSNILNGSNSKDFLFSTQAIAGKYITFDFGKQVYIDEITVSQELNVSNGSWQVQGSNNGSDWTNIGGTQSPTNSGSSFYWEHVFDLSSNTTSRYRYYKILGVSGTMTTTWKFEYKFKIEAQTGLEIGDRTSLITATTDMTINAGTPSLLVNGTYITDFLLATQTTAGKYIKFDMGSPQVVIRFLAYRELNQGFGSWQMQGSHDDINWDNIGGTQTPGNTNTQGKWLTALRIDSAKPSYSVTASGTLDGSDGQSKVFGDRIFNAIWPNKVLEQGTYSEAITGNRLALTITADGSTDYIVRGNNTTINHEGDLDVSVDFDISDFPNPSGTFTSWISRLRISLGVNTYYVERINDNGTKHLRYQDGDGLSALIPDSTDIGAFRIVRVGTTMTMYIAGNLVSTSTVSGVDNLVMYGLDAATNANTALSYTAYYDNFQALDGVGGDDILIETDPNAVPALAVDVSGNGYDGTINGDPIFTGVDGKLTTDGVGDYVGISSIPISGLRTYYWRGNYTKPITTSDTLFGDSNCYVQMDTSGYVVAYAGTLQTMATTDFSGADHTFALEIAADGTAKLYVDGTLVGTQSIGTGSNAALGIFARNDGDSPVVMTGNVPLAIQGAAYDSGINTLVNQYS